MSAQPQRGPDPGCQDCAGRGVVDVDDLSARTCNCVKLNRLRFYVHAILGTTEGLRPNESRLTEQGSNKIRIVAPWTDLVAHARAAVVLECCKDLSRTPSVRIATDEQLRAKYMRETDSTDRAARLLYDPKNPNPELYAKILEQSVSFADYIKKPALLIIRLGVQTIPNSLIPDIILALLSQIRLGERYKTA